MIDEKKTLALILAQLEPSDEVSIEIEPGESEAVELSPEEQLQAVAGELVEAVHCGDAAAVAEALRGAFLLLDSMPHVEGEHVSETPEESEEEESSDPYEAVSHELRERFGGYREAEEEGHAYGGKAGRKRYARGGTVRRYADGGMVPAMQRQAAPAGALRMPGPVSAGPRAPELASLTSRARTMIGQAGGMPASPGVTTSGPASMISRDALANALASRGRR